MVDITAIRSPRLSPRRMGSDQRVRRGSNSDSDSLRSKSSRVSDRLQVTDCNFAIKRLLDDLDSGTSTIDHDQELDAIRVLDTVILDHDQTRSVSISEEKDRSLTEVQEQSVRFENLKIFQEIILLLNIIRPYKLSQKNKLENSFCL